MKYLSAVILVALISMPLIGYTETNQVVADNSSMAFHMDVNDLTSQVTNALKPIAEKIGQGAEAVYKMAVKDAYITGVESAVYSAISLVIMIISLVLGKRAYVAGAADEWDNGEYVAGVVVAYIVAFISFWVCLAWFSDALHYYMNPEYMALKDLLKAVQPKVTR